MKEDLTTLDLRPLPPRERHAAVHAAFGALGPGQAFELLNDHDPMPLQLVFQAMYGDAHLWQPTVHGPEEWRVRISRR